MNNLSNTFLRLGVLTALIGMSLGAWMGATQNFTLMPVHAHINLLGFVSMLLIGLFYRGFPAAAQGWMPKVHFALMLIGFLIMIPALTMYLLGNPVLAPLLGISSVILVSSMLVFVIIVFRATGGRIVAA